MMNDRTNLAEGWFFSFPKTLTFETKDVILNNRHSSTYAIFSTYFKGISKGALSIVPKQIKTPSTLPGNY